MKIQIDEKQVLRFLGYGKREPVEKIKKMVNEEVKRSNECLDPEFYSKKLKVVSNEDGHIGLENGIKLEGEYVYSQFKDCEYVIANVVTVGDRIGERIDTYMSKRETMRGLICDKIAIVALDFVVDENRNRVINEIKDKGLNVTSEVFPGENSWDVENQKKIFETLKDENINVTLNEFSMMNPVKSTAFFWGIGKGKAMDCGHRCSRCNNPCPFKEESWK